MLGESSGLPKPSTQHHHLEMSVTHAARIYTLPTQPALNFAYAKKSFRLSLLLFTTTEALLDPLPVLLHYPLLMSSGTSYAESYLYKPENKIHCYSISPIRKTFSTIIMIDLDDYGILSIHYTQ